MKRKSVADSDTVAIERPAKRQITDEEAKHQFREDLFDPNVLHLYTKKYAESQPYKHGVIPSLISPTLLRSVRNEILANISFTCKETDIYKIHQSGDLANLDGLEDSSLSLLPSILTLRDALYSHAFREYLAKVTGSGPLSGRKTDMAVNVYTPGCHLLCHDDVIGTRRVSYILYLTDPDRPWKEDWGGALRLYATEEFGGRSEDGTIEQAKVPRAEWEVRIPPAWNQLSYFSVQPGESFHDVEEVYAKIEEDIEDDGGRFRMAISGWYHIPQIGEEGFQESTEDRQLEKSSLMQLHGKAEKYDLPQPDWIEHDESIHEGHADGHGELTEDDLNHLLKFMNPRYLTPDTVAELCETFSEESCLRLALFLSDKLAAAVKAVILNLDGQSALLPDWRVARPPHKHRFAYRQPNPLRPATSDGHSDNAEDPLVELINGLFPSVAFKKWLSLATGLDLEECSILARRFRRGLDYTLANGYDELDPRLELCLGLTPTTGWGEDEESDEDVESSHGFVKSGSPNGTVASTSTSLGISMARDAHLVREGGVGGYEVYMAGDDSDDEEGGSNHGIPIPSTHTGAGKRRGRADPAIYKSTTAEEDDGVLFSMPACWNTLSIVLRDTGVLRFVKYVSRSANGDRWDLAGEWKAATHEDGNTSVEQDP